jgi:predicted outer membrane repeat protein
LVIFQDCGPMTRLENLTLTAPEGGMVSPVARGGGVNLMNASPVVSNVIILGYEADYGGGVYCGDGSNPFFQNCWFDGNYARATGGAVACTGASSPVFDHCLFADNSAEASGGTINSALGSAPSLIQCTVSGGRGAVGSGVSSWDAAGLVMNGVIMVDGQTGRAWDGDAASAPAPECTDIFGNEGGDWVGALAPHEATGGNISADPQFCGVIELANPFFLNDESPCATALLPGCDVMGAFGVNCSYVSGVGQGSGGLPTVSRLHSNFPNPFNPRTTIKFDISRSGPVELAVFDLAGRLVKRLVSESMSAGNHEAVWEGRDSGGRRASAGVYFFRLKTTDTIDTKRMTLIK